MIITVTKNKLLLCSGVLVTILAIGIFARTLAVTSETVPVQPHTVLIDAGHGGEDGGAVGVSGVLEKELNLQVALKLARIFEEGGYTALFTRVDDRSLHDDGKKTIKAKKASDLANRRKIMRESGAAAFVSIHMNTYPDSRYRGAQVFYATSNEESTVLAENVRAGLLEGLQEIGKREIKPVASNILIMKDVSLPAIIVECGFISNPEDEALLQTDEYQQKLAQCIYEGVAAYLAGVNAEPPQFQQDEQQTMQDEQQTIDE